MMKRKALVLLWAFAVFSLLFICAFLQWEDDGNVIAATWIPRSPIDTAAGKQACVVPYLNPKDPSIADLIRPEPTLDCGNGLKPIIHSNLTHVWVNGINRTNCCYQRLEHSQQDGYRYVGDCVKLPVGGMLVDQTIEFLRVHCNSSSEGLDKSSPLRDFHAFVPLKEGYKDSSESGKISVLMLGLDSVSRSNFHRQMPLTVELLRRLGAIEMMGYNKVADNTFPNMVPVLAGLSEVELKKRCWPTKVTTFDNCPFIWKDFAESGYRTLFLEDIPYIGMFNYMKAGFQNPPAKYYLYPFMKALDEEIGHNGLETSNRCAGARLQVDIIMNYVEKFVTAFSSALYWGLVWSTSLSHDNLNAPQLIDPFLHDTLERLYRDNHFNNTVLVLLSDHGSRIGEIRKTVVGRLEERLPFLYFVFPQWFKEHYSSVIDVLKKNTRRLTSPYDLHETMMDLLHLPTLGSRPPTERGRSLLGPVPVPLGRTCKDAGISNHWCTCHKSSVVDTISSKAEEIAQTLVDFINGMLEPYRPQCAKLSLTRVVEILAWEHPVKSSEHGHDYLVTIKTSPGGALFEATMINHGGELQVQQKDISRINRYGNQSACIQDFHMKLFCYCINHTTALLS